MKLSIFCIFDLKSGVHQAPFFSHNQDTAMRLIALEMENPGSLIGRFPKDYELYFLGEWNDENGEIVSGIPYSVASLIEIAEPAQTMEMFENA